MVQSIDPPDPTNLVPPAPSDTSLTAYARGWNEIAQQLQNRLSALPLVGVVHRFIKWTKESPDSTPWEEQFMSERADGRLVVNSIIINGSTSPAPRVSPDNSNWWIQRTSVELHIVLEIEDPISWYLWHSILRSIVADLRNGDRTLNQTCLTYELPGPVESTVASFCGVDCHTALMRFQIEEVGMFVQ